MNSCQLCPRKCQVDRTKNQLGFCQAPNKLIIARYSLHMWEEPCISGSNGSGTIFFSYCNLKCIFCQNYNISTLHKGRPITIKEFANICCKLQTMGANNINLVTPTMFIPLIKKGLQLAKKNGLKIPIIYNTSSYETIEALKSLEGLIDIYLPDLKYYSDELARKYSNAPDYFQHASRAIEEMYRQVGIPKFNHNGLIQKGVIVRHLVLPTHQEDSKKIINYLYQKYQNNIYLSIMNQYTPIKILKHRELNTTVNEKIYNDIIDYACDLGIENAYVQERHTQEQSFIPDFTQFSPSK